MVDGTNNCARKKKRTAEFEVGTEREFGHVYFEECVKQIPEGICK